MDSWHCPACGRQFDTEMARAWHIGHEERSGVSAWCWCDATLANSYHLAEHLREAGDIDAHFVLHAMRKAHE